MFIQQQHLGANLTWTQLTDNPNHFQRSSVSLAYPTLSLDTTSFHDIVSIIQTLSSSSQQQHDRHSHHHHHHCNNHSNPFVSLLVSHQFLEILFQCCANKNINFTLTVTYNIKKKFFFLLAYNIFRVGGIRLLFLLPKNVYFYIYVYNTYCMRIFI